MDFLTFKSFISIETLIVLYYMGAVAMPIGLFLSLAWFIQKFSLVKNSLEQGKKQLWSRLTGLQKFKTLLFLTTTFLFMELFWRMLFEFLIAYMQIRDALVTFP
jgi:hypothetical protein